MQVKVNVKSICTNFCKYCLSGFGDLAPSLFTFKTAKFPFRTIVHEGQKIELAKKIYASRGGCEMHANQFWWV